MNTGNRNSEILSSYIAKRIEDNKNIPHITLMSKETGVSMSTISRYAKRKGFYNYGELRASFNKSNGKTIINTKGFEMVLDYDTIHIVTSKSTRLVGEFILDRFDFVGDKKIEIVNENTKWTKNDVTIFVTLSSESAKVSEVMQKAKGKKVVLAGQRNPDLSRRVRQIIVPDTHLETRNVYNISNSVVKLINWVNDSLNYIQLKIENKI